MMSEPAPSPAGWYAQADGRQRYWDGTSWTEHFSHGPGALVPVPLGQAPLVHSGVGPVRVHHVAPKNPGLALLASFFIPGLGSLINGQALKGIGILAGYIFGAVLTASIFLALFGVPAMLAFWIWGMVDGYQGARRWNASHGILS